METVLEIRRSEEFKAMQKRLVIAAFLDEVRSYSSVTCEIVSDCCGEIIDKIADAIIAVSDEAESGTIIPSFFDITGVEKLLDFVGHTVTVDVLLERWEPFKLDELIVRTEQRTMIFRQGSFLYTENDTGMLVLD